MIKNQKLINDLNEYLNEYPDEYLKWKSYLNTFDINKTTPKLPETNSEKEKFFIGIKLVRGAYIEQENKRAIKNNYKSPICDSKNLTDTNFNNGASFILSNLNIFSLFSGTHNEESIYKIIDIMKLNNINKNNSKIWFGQLYGMSDNISFNLANKGFNAIKYLPFGPIKEVIPYLIRRAEENTSVAGQTGRELSLIKKEIKNRK